MQERKRRATGGISKTDPARSWYYMKNGGPQWTTKRNRADIFQNYHVSKWHWIRCFWDIYPRTASERHHTKTKAYQDLALKYLFHTMLWQILELLIMKFELRVQQSILLASCEQRKAKTGYQFWFVDMTLTNCLMLQLFPLNATRQLENLSLKKLSSF